MSAVTVRAAGPEDAPAVSALTAAYHERTESEKVGHGLQVAGPLAPAYAAEIAAPFTAFAGADVLLAERDDVPVGMVVLKPDGEIKRLWVDPGSRGSGAGSTLLADAAARAAGHGAASLRLSVWDWRDDALGLYTARGFEIVPSWESRARLVCLRRPLDAA